MDRTDRLGNTSAKTTRSFAMPETEAKVAAWFARQTRWTAELAALRSVLRASPLTEEFKWRSPTYTWAGANIVNINAFAEFCALGFFKGVLLDNPEGLLEAQGENSRSMRILKITERAQVLAWEEPIRGFISQAIALDEAGAKVDLPPDDFELPEELADRLDADPDLAAAWHALTPGRRRGWALQIAGARQSATRQSRIDKALPRILGGKGLHDR